MKISILFYFLTFSVFGTELKETQFHLFTYDQYGKVLNIKEIIIVPNGIMVGGAMLSSTELTIKSKYLSDLNKIKKSNSKNCSEGKYIFRINAKGQDSIESGCLSSKRFTELSNIFVRMQKDVMIK